MKSEVKWAFLMLFMAIAFFSLVFEMAAHADEVWNGRMQAMASSITCLAPYVASDEKFVDPKNQLQIKSCVDDLAAQTKSLKLALSKRQPSQSSDALHQLDPLFPLMAASFADDIETARGLLTSDSGPYAQHLLRGSLSYCVSCHTRTGEHSTIKFPVFGDAAQGLKLSDRMKLATATRNFDEALADFKRSIASPKSEGLNSAELERSAKLALAIEVRVARDGKKALALVDQIAMHEGLTAAFKSELADWKKSLIEMSPVVPMNASASSKFASAQALIAKAQLPSKRDHSEDSEVNYLRASSLIHEFLESRPSDQMTAEALYGLGTCYEHLSDVGFWSVNETYYEACIRKAPHSEIARRCLTPLRESITLGYSGSSGIHIPANVQTRLRELEMLAKK